MRWSMAEGLYHLVWGAALIAGAPYGLVRYGLHGREMAERWGSWRALPVAPGCLWVHVASVGEARAARGLLGALAGRGEEALVTAVTPAARALEAELVAHGAAGVRQAPLDFLPCVRRALRHAAPRGMLFLETEIWPGLLRAAAEQRVAVGFLSARLSEEALGRWARVRGALAPLIATAWVAAQSEADARRWRALGVPAERTAVTGNIKYECPAGPLPARQRAAQRGGWRRVVVFGSVRRAEIEVVRRAIEACRRQGEAALFVVAPRHPGRAGERVRQELRESLPIHQRATPGEELLPSGGKGGDAILLVETIGELPRFYALADLAFVGGTFGSLGGHNLFEAAEWGVPVFFGPSTEKVAEVAAALEAAGGGEAVGDGESLGRALRRLLGDPAARERAGAGALQAARQLGGALERTLRALEGWGYPLRAGGAPGRQGPAGGAVPAEAATQAAGRGAGHGAGRR